MSIIEYRDKLRAEINEREMGKMMERINYLKGKVKCDTSVFPEPIDYDNATAQLSILEETYELEKELGMHTSIDGFGNSWSK